MPALPLSIPDGATSESYGAYSLNLKRQPSPASLFARQSDGNDGGGGGGGGTCLGGGAIAGIVIGTIAGTLLVLWLIRSCTGAFGGTRVTAAPYPESEHKRRHHSRSHHSRRRSSGLSEPPPVLVSDRSRSSHRQPTYVYADDRSRGRR